MRTLSQQALPSKKAPPKRKAVQVVKCPSAFPISTNVARQKRHRSADGNEREPNHAKNAPAANLLDWHETAKEIRAYGATAFVGQQKRDYKDEQYYKLTGRHQKKQQVPLPIVRGINKARAKREAKAKEEARQAGVVLPKSADKSTQNRKAYDRTYEKFGPAPSIGFTKNGIFRVNNNSKGKSQQKR